MRLFSAIVPVVPNVREADVGDLLNNIHEQFTAVVQMMLPTYDELDDLATHGDPEEEIGGTSKQHKLEAIKKWCLRDAGCVELGAGAARETYS